KRGNLVPLQSGSSSINIQTVFEETDPVYQSLLDRWLRLLDFPVPTYRRVAFDIEVHSPIDTRVPDPQEAEYKVICASFASNENQQGSNTAFISTFISSSSIDQSKSMHSAANIENPRSTLYRRHFSRPES